MGNRQNRSTEAAMRITIEAVRAAWARDGTVLLKMLDIDGAFNEVPHERLGEMAAAQRFPPWLCSWLASFLEGRTARLRFDGETSPRRPVRSGVPQGSPLSPILLILYIASLYRALQDVEGTITVGFADDTNIISIGRDTEQARGRLETAWKVCKDWSTKSGLRFNPAKTELIHFTKERNPTPVRIRIENTTIRSRDHARFLGIWLDRKLNWRKHTQEMLKKAKTQVRALTVSATATWGCDLFRAREIYTKVIRAALVYGCPAYHTPTENKKIHPPARAFAKIQSDALRRVLGAYKATPIRMLETEAAIPPIDLYMTQLITLSERRLVNGEIAPLIRAASTLAARTLKRRWRKRTYRKPDEERQAWMQQNVNSAEWPMEEVWRSRWEPAVGSIRRRRHRPTDPADQEFIGADKKTVRKRHTSMKKHESSVLTQIRTGRIGYRAFLFHRNVPEVATPYCRCGTGRQTAEHMVAWCPELNAARTDLPFPLSNRAEMIQAVDRGEPARSTVRLLLDSGTLQQFTLAEQLAKRADQRQTWGPQ